MDLRNEEYIKALIHCYLSNQACDKDIEDLQLWINQSDDNKRQFIEFRSVWILTSQTAPQGKFNKAKYDEWEKLSKKLAGGNIKIPAKRILALQTSIRIAAVFLLFLSIGTTLAWRITSHRLHSFINREIVHQINVPKGSKSEVILPDGTKISLNAGSSLSYSGNFGLTDRNVFLAGEGYFDVQTNPQLPFIVEAFGLKIKAIGTIFNVKAYPEERSLTTTLIKGIVEIEGEGVDLTMTPMQKVSYILSENMQMLPAGEKTGQAVKKSIQKSTDKIAEAAIIGAPQIQLASNVNVRELTAWKDGYLVFKAEKLSTLAVLLERKFDVSIKIESEELLNHIFTGTFHMETLEQILNIINLSAPMKYQIKEGVVIIQVDKERSVIFKDILN